MAAPVAVGSDGQTDINTAVYVGEIRPGAEGSILICGEGNKHPICVIQNCSEFVYIYENTIRKLALLGIVRLPSGCQCMCVSRDPQGREHLVFCLKDGRVIQQNVQCFKEETRAKKKKKKKDKHKVQVPLPGGGGDCPPGNQEIFDDLLSEANPSSSAAHPTDIIQDQFVDKVVALGDDHVIFNQPNVQDVMFVNGCLITCAECTSGWKLSVYRQRGTTSPPHDASTNHFEFNKSPEFQTVLHGRPISSKSPGDSSFFGSRRPSLHIGETYMEEEPNMRENTEEEPNMQEKPQLFCVISQSMLGNEKTTIANFSKTLTLEDSLYETLFGSNFNLRDVPILLISLPNGYIYKFPLRPNRSTPSELDPTGSNWYRQWTRVFWVSDQPVAFISGLRAVPNQTEQNDFSSSCLCILGRYGQVVCFTENNYADQREKWKYTIKSFNHGTVQTACKTRTRQGILYSTGKEIYCLSLSNSEASDSSTTEDSVSCSPLLGVAEIRALAELGRPRTDDTPRQMPGNSQLVALTVSGSVLKLSLPPVGSRGNTTQPITAAAAGKRVQESLQALNNISARSCELAKRGETQDLILREVCKACHLATMLLSECKLSGSSRLFKVDTECAVRNNGMLCDMELLCKVTNHSQLSLSHGWALTVSMETASEQTKVAEGSKCSVTKSVQLVDFQDRQTVEVILPLLDGKVSLSLPVNIQTCLHFSPREYMSWLLPEKNINAGSRIDLGESGISLPLNEPRVIDLMTVLRPVQEDAADVQGDRVATRQCQMTTNSGSDWLASALQDTANLRHSTYQTAPATGGTSDKSVDVCITLGSDVRTMIFKKHKNEHKNDGCSRQEQVLNWLLEENKFTTQSTNPISLRTRDGKVVTFEVKGQQRRQSGAGRGSEIREAVKVVVKAPDYPTLTQLQLAVNQRIKVILEREGSDVGITATQEQLQNELSKVKTLQKNLQKNQDAASQDKPSSTQWHTNAQSTLKLYQQLRTQLNFL